MVSQQCITLFLLLGMPTMVQYQSRMPVSEMMMSVPTLAIVIGIFIDGLLITKCRRHMNHAFDEAIERMNQTVRYLELRLK